MCERSLAQFLSITSCSNSPPSSLFFISRNMCNIDICSLRTHLLQKQSANSNICLTINKSIHKIANANRSTATCTSQWSTSCSSWRAQVLYLIRQLLKDHLMLNETARYPKLIEIAIYDISRPNIAIFDTVFHTLSHIFVHTVTVNMRKRSILVLTGQYAYWQSGQSICVLTRRYAYWLTILSMYVLTEWPPRQ